MAKKKIYCCESCGAQNLSKNAVGICKKLLGSRTKNFYCEPCLAEFLGVTVEDIRDKIEDFRNEGCKLFE